MKYVLFRVNQGKGWVTKPGAKKSYTQRLQHARIFNSREEADRERCSNEIIQTIP